jgi:hypothetical protein
MPITQQENHWPEKMTFEEKLEALQISEVDFHFYTSTFIQDRRRYLIKETGKEWEEMKSKNGKSVPLNDNAICYHLIGKYTIASVAPRISRYLCLVTGVMSNSGVIPFYQEAIQWLQTPLIFFSRNTRLLQFYAHFNFTMSTEKLFSIVTGEPAFSRISRGFVYWEIRPLGDRFLRLPLGNDSVVIDPQTFKPACDGVKEGIEFIRHQLRPRTFKQMFPEFEMKFGNPSNR